MRRLWTSAILAAVLFGGGAASARLMTPELEWKKLTEALKLSTKNKKKVVLDIYTDWCGWCKRMDVATYTDANVVAYLNKKWIASKINPERNEKVVFQKQEASNAQFCNALGVNGYPATAFFDENNQLLTVVSGYIGPDDYMRILKYFGEDIYKTMKWEDYVKIGDK